MKVLLDIKDSKADFIMELPNGFSAYVKAKPISASKSSLFEDLTDAAADVRLHKQGKAKIKNCSRVVAWTLKFFPVVPNPPERKARPLGNRP